MAEPKIKEHELERHTNDEHNRITKGPNAAQKFQDRKRKPRYGEKVVTRHG